MTSRKRFAPFNESRFMVPARILPAVLILLLVPAAAIALGGPVPGMDFVEIPGKIYYYGRVVDSCGRDLEHGNLVSLQNFQIMNREVTQDIWQMVMGGNVQEYLAEMGVEELGPDLPMCCVSFNDCLEFVDSLNAMDPEYFYYVPPVEYWAYACRAGALTPYSWGSDSLGTMSRFCWYGHNSQGMPHPVGTRESNEWGLYDMNGNVGEWCDYTGGRAWEDPETGETSMRQVIRGGCYSSSAYECRIDRVVCADSDHVSPEAGFRVMRVPRDSSYVDEDLTDWQRRLHRHMDEHRFAAYLEPVLAVGGISHNFDDDDIQQFGYDVKGGCEQDAAYIRAGLGKYFGRFSAFLYGEAGYIGPGCLIDNHGPYILPEVLLNMTELSGGLELRYWPVRVSFGVGSYGGSAEVDEDTVGSGPTGSWTTDIVDGSGFNYTIGFYGPVTDNILLGVQWSQHFIDLRLAESGTGVPPTMHEARQSEVRFFVDFQLPFGWSDIF